MVVGSMIAEWFIFILPLKINSTCDLARNSREWITEASHSAAARSVTVKPTGCWSDPHSRRWNIYLNLYFHFFAPVSKIKRGVEFCHSTRNASRIRHKVGTESARSVLTLGSLCLSCCVRDTAWSWVIDLFYLIVFGNGNNISFHTYSKFYLQSPYVYFD